MAGKTETDDSQVAPTVQKFEKLIRAVEEGYRGDKATIGVSACGETFALSVRGLVGPRVFVTVRTNDEILLHEERETDRIGTAEAVAQAFGEGVARHLTWRYDELPAALDLPEN